MFGLQQTMKEVARDTGRFTIECTAVALEKTADAVRAFAQNHPAIAGMAANWTLFLLKCPVAVLEKTADASRAFVQNHPAIAEMTVNQAMQASFSTAIALSALAQSTGFYEAIYGPDNRFHQCGVATLYTISIAGIVYLRSGRAPAVLDQLTMGEACHNVINLKKNIPMFSLCAL